MIRLDGKSREMIVRCIDDIAATQALWMRVAQTLVMAIVLSVVVCSELPELIRLVDNTTNDFTTPASLIEEPESVRASQPAVRITVLQCRPRYPLRDVFRRRAPLNLSRDLLSFYSIIRV
jgi:hypothetical protein